MCSSVNAAQRGVFTGMSFQRAEQHALHALHVLIYCNIKSLDKQAFYLRRLPRANFKRADAAMYQDKVAMKAERKD